MKIFKIKYRQILIISIVMLGLFSGSCEKYLDKAPSSDITEKDVFSNFISFQGFIEELYNCVVNYPSTEIPVHYLFADETLYNSPLAFDMGDYWFQRDLFYSESFSTVNAPRTKRIWPLCWYGIRKANIAIADVGTKKIAPEKTGEILIKERALGI